MESKQIGLVILICVLAIIAAVSSTLYLETISKDSELTNENSELGNLVIFYRDYLITYNSYVEQATISNEYVYGFNALSNEYSMGGAILPSNYEYYYDEYIIESTKELEYIELVIKMVDKMPESISTQEAILSIKSFEDAKDRIINNRKLMKESIDQVNSEGVDAW